MHAAQFFVAVGNVWSVDQGERNMIVQKQLARCVYMS